MDISIIIVNYNTRDLLRDCLTSIYSQTKNISFEVIISDNGSTDGSIELIKSEFSQVKIIKNGKNLGFGTANNRGLDIAAGKYVFYLNSDTVFLNNALWYFYKFYENYPKPDELGVLGCNLFDGTMHIARSNWPFPAVSREIKYRIKINFRLFILTICHLLKYNPPAMEKKSNIEKKIGEVDGFICGADLFLKNDKSVRFDEKFFLYSEESDLEYRLHEKGKKIILIDGPEIMHLSGGSNVNNDAFERYFSFSMIQFHISSILYFRNRNINFGIGLIKFLIVLFLCNPFQVSKTSKYIPGILKL